MEFLYIAVGILALVGGGEILVRGAITLARNLGLSPMVIGVTVVGFGTSMPELVTSVTAALSGSPGVAAGNVVGSNIANILLILGFAALLSPVAVNPRGFGRDSTVLFLSAAAAMVLIFWGEAGRLAGFGLMAALAVYLVAVMRSGADIPEDDIETALDPVWKSLLFVLGGLAGTIIGARLLVVGAVEIATAAGLSEAVIGLTLVAVGTSLPELVTAIIAARKGMADVAFGNIVGSNIFNILGILGATALISPIPIPAEMTRDAWILGGATLIMLVNCRTGWRVSRAEGATLLALYLAYLWLLWP